MIQRKGLLFGGILAGLLWGLVSPLHAQQEQPSALSGFEPSELYDVTDREPLKASNEFLIRLLFRAANASPESWERYAQFTRGVQLAAISEEPQPHRFQVFELSGRVKMVWPFRLPATYENSKLKGFYLVRVESADGKPYVIACRSLPRVWPVRQPIDEPIRCHGFFQTIADFSSPLDSAIGRDLGGDLEFAPLFVADRLGWFPDRLDGPTGVSESQIRLARYGVDIGQFEFVKQNNNRAITEQDATCFFQMLTAVGQLTAADFKGERANFVELLQNPKEHFGGAVQFTGHVKRAVRIYIDRKAVRERMGIDYYYELDMFVPLGDSRIVIKNGVAGEGGEKPQDLVYQNRFPATVCVLQLPGTPDEIRGKRVTIDGFFMKFWNYESEFTAGMNPTLGQVSPLVIGVEPTINNSSGNAIDNILLLSLAVMGAGVVGLILYFRRSDQRLRNLRDQTSQDFELSHFEGPDLGVEAEGDGSEGPDAPLR